MSRPLLQLALDHTSLQAAQRDVATLSDHVDIVEAGTILCLTEGLNAVRALFQILVFPISGKMLDTSQLIFAPVLFALFTVTEPFDP